MADRPRVALVTGASGFVGSHLVEALVARGWRPRALVRRSSNLRWLPREGVTFAHGDVGDGSSEGARALADAVRGADAVFHLAGVTSAATVQEYERVNAGGTARIAAAIAQAASGAHLVLCSSLAAAGPPQPGRPARERDAPHPEGAYGRSKLAAEHAAAASGVRLAIVRPPAVYGPRDVDILAAFRLAARGLAMRTAPPGQRLSMVHARDLAHGLVIAAERDARGLYYMSDGAVHTWAEITQALADAVGRRARVIPVPGVVTLAAAHANRAAARLLGIKPLLTPDRARELAGLEWTCDDTRARTELGYRSEYTLAEGMRDTARWYREAGWL